MVQLNSFKYTEVLIKMVMDMYPIRILQINSVDFRFKQVKKKLIV